MEINFYPPDNNDFFTLNYVCGLVEKQRRILFNGLNTIKQMGFRGGVKTKTIKTLNKQEKIYEFIIGDHRLVFMRIGKECWILHGFLKKGQKTRRKDVNIAINLKYRLLNLLDKK